MRKIVVDSIQNASSTTDISFFPSQATDKPAYISNTNSRFEDVPAFDEINYFHGPENASAVSRVTIPLYDGSDAIGHRKLRVLYHIDHAGTDPTSSLRRVFNFIPRDSSGTALTLEATYSSEINFYNNWASHQSTVAAGSLTDRMRLSLGRVNESTDHALANHAELNIFYQAISATKYQIVIYGTSITQRADTSSYMGCGPTYTRGFTTTQPSELTFDVSVGTSSTNNPKAFKVIDLYEGA